MLEVSYLYCILKAIDLFKDRNFMIGRRAEQESFYGAETWDFMVCFK